jgi:hypothetical protein
MSTDMSSHILTAELATLLRRQMRIALLAAYNRGLDDEQAKDHAIRACSRVWKRQYGAGPSETIYYVLESDLAENIQPAARQEWLQQQTPF